MSEYSRLRLKVNRLYHLTGTPHEQWLYTPDGVGLIWYDTEAEALEQTEAFGEPIITIYDLPDRP